MKTRLLLATAAALALSSASVSAEPPALFEGVFVGGPGFSFTVQDSGDQSFVNYQDADGFCSNFDLGDADLVDVSGSGRTATGSLDDVLSSGDLVCVGTSLTSLSFECESDGVFEAKTVGNTTTINNGVRFTFHGRTMQSTAACTVLVDGEELEGQGSMFRVTNHTGGSNNSN